MLALHRHTCQKIQERSRNMDIILTCNAGSSSLRCAAYSLHTLECIYHFEASSIHSSSQCVITNNAQEKISEHTLDVNGHAAAFTYCLEWLRKQEHFTIISIGHRIVHGGQKYHHAVWACDVVKSDLTSFIPLAPLHQPYNLELLDIAEQNLPQTRQFVCFDTAFHRTQSELAQSYALPSKFTQDEGIIRYGFHGLSYEYIAHLLESQMHKRTIAVHLGGGASACALLNRKSVATTMGFTALDGLMMGTRCGDLDPGVILYLQQKKGMSLSEIEHLLYKESGLLGVSGISDDMRIILASDMATAKHAVSLFCYSAARHIGSLIPTLGGLDTLIFTGAIGKNSAFVRHNICQYLEYIGIALDEKCNKNNTELISSKHSKILVYAYETNEEWIIAQHGKILLQEQV